MNLSEVLNIPPYINVLSELAERSLTVTDPIRQLRRAFAPEVQQKLLVDLLNPWSKHHRRSWFKTPLPNPDGVQGLTTLASGVLPAGTAKVTGLTTLAGTVSSSKQRHSR